MSLKKHATLINNLRAHNSYFFKGLSVIVKKIYFTMEKMNGALLPEPDS